MTYYDAAMAIVVILGMIRGAWRGFTWQAASIASLIVGYTVAHSGSAQLAAHLPGEPEVQRVLAMAVLYIAVSGGIFAIARMIRGTLRKLKFEAYDRHLGLLLGGAEGIGVGLLLTMFVVSVAPETRQPIFGSPTGHVVGIIMDKLGPVLPAEVRKVLMRHWNSDAQAPETVAASGPLGTRGDDRPAANHSKADPAAAELPAVLPPADQAAAPAQDNPSTAATEQPGLPSLDGPRDQDSSVRQTSGPGSSGTLQKFAAAGRDRLARGQQQIEQKISERISRGEKALEQSVTDSIDQQLHKLGGLTPDSAKEPQ
jgi:membrane protein required for colicin V production